MPTREEMIQEVLDDYNKEHAPHAHDTDELKLRLELYHDVKEIKGLLQKIVDKQG